MGFDAIIRISTYYLVLERSTCKVRCALTIKSRSEMCIIGKLINHQRFRTPPASVYHNSISDLIAGGKNEPECLHRGPEGISTSALKATCQVCFDQLKIASL